VSRPRPGLFSLSALISRGGLHQCRSEKSSQGEPARGQDVPFSSHVQAHTPGESRVFAPVGMEGTRETDSPLEGTGFEPSVPRQEKWSMLSSSDQTRVGRTLTLGGGAESGKEIRTLGPSRGQNAVGAHLPETLGCAAAIPRGTVAAVGDEFDCMCQYLAAGLRHRAQPCSGCAGNFRSRHLIPGGAESALLEGFHRR
jgi:hypothetical protein